MTIEYKDSESHQLKVTPSEARLYLKRGSDWEECSDIITMTEGILKTLGKVKSTVRGRFYQNNERIKLSDCNRKVIFRNYIGD